MTSPWSAQDLERIGAARELQIAVERADGTRRRPKPIWKVCVDDQVYVRSWWRRDTGWFGQALRFQRAGVRTPGLESRVVGEDVGDEPPGLRERFDTVYRAKYGASGSESVITDSAAATTLRLSPAPATGHTS